MLSSQLLPEFFALLGVNVFLLLSLLSCLLEDRLPNMTPYVYQIAALVGYGHLLISKGFLAVFGEYTRFWYCFLYLLVALSNVVAINIYFAINKRMWTLARLWSGAITFPLVVISVFFASNYTVLQAAVMPLLTLQIGLVLSVFAMGICVFLLLSPEIRRLKIQNSRSIDEV